jgi:hypothetical protein
MTSAGKPAERAARDAEGGRKFSLCGVTAQSISKRMMNVKKSILKSRTGAAVDKMTIEAFRRGFSGQALLPGDAGYDSARRIWNASIDKHPGLIVRCSDAADVVRAVKFSRAKGLSGNYRIDF